jgi:hypothetical protein
MSKSTASVPKNVTRVGQSPPPLAYSIKDAAEALGGLSERFLRLEISRGHLSVVSLGRRRVLTAEELARYLAENGQQS